MGCEIGLSSHPQSLRTEADIHSSNPTGVGHGSSEKAVKELEEVVNLPLLEEKSKL